MSRFIKNPNLPEGKVTSLVCGGLNEEAVRLLKDRGAEIFYTEKNTSVDESVSYHCDISALYLGDGKIVVDNQQEALMNNLKIKGFDVVESQKTVCGMYPNDIILNHAIVGEYIIGKSSCFDKSVAENIADLKVIDVKQGYAKCSVLVVDGCSIITDDESIASNAHKNGLNCLLIEKGDILLGGHEYGFIGGASGKISNNEILFFGDITKHRDYDKIKDFLSRRNIGIISLDFPLTDFGGIIPLTED